MLKQYVSLHPGHQCVLSSPEQKFSRRCVTVGILSRTVIAGVVTSTVTVAYETTITQSAH